MAIDVTSETFEREVLQSEKPVLVDFWAPWCAPCRRLAPVLDELSRELSDQIRFVKVNTDQCPDLPGKFGVMSIPTLILFKGGQEATRLVGLVPRSELKQRLATAL
ncbi:MAG TPA: thioredoxin [Limnochordia bacterium]